MANDGQRGAPGHTALLIIDMINDLAFSGAEDMLDAIEAAAEAIADCAKRRSARVCP
jgi:nicotinamidase-related amidase